MDDKRIETTPSYAGNKEASSAPSEIVVKTNHLIQEITTAATSDRTAVKEVNLGLLEGRTQRKAAKSGQMYIAIEAPNVKGLNLRPSAQKLFRLINAGVTASHYKYGDREKACTVQIPIDAAMDLCKQTSEKAFIRTGRADIRTLGSLSFTEDYGKVSFLDLPLKGGYCGYDESLRAFTFTVSGDAMHTIFSKTSSVMPLHPEVFAIDAQKHKAAWAIADKLINYRWSNPDNEHQMILSVERLLNACASCLPSEDELKAGRQSPKGRIEAPIVDALNHLANDVDVLEYWDFCHDGGADLTDEEQRARFDEEGNETILPEYAAFKKLYIRYALAHDSEAFRQRRLEGREQSAIKAKAIREERKKLAEKSEARTRRKAEDIAAKELAKEIERRALEDLDKQK